MRSLDVGIVCEGGNDCEVIACIMKRLMELQGFTFSGYQSYQPNTMILPFLPAYVQKFTYTGVDLCVFCTDQDEDSISRRNQIIKKVQSVDEAFALKTIAAVPVPHIEAWLLLDENTVKKILGLDATQPLAHADLQPKSRLAALYGDSDTFLNSQNDLRIIIAKEMDLKECKKRDSGFNRFADDLRQLLQTLSQ